MLGVLYPHYLAPIPSMAVVQFVLDRGQGELRTGYEVSSGSAVETDAIEGEPCRFRTCYPTTLWPITLSSATLTGRPLTAPAHPIQSRRLGRVATAIAVPLQGRDVLANVDAVVAVLSQRTNSTPLRSVRVAFQQRAGRGAGRFGDRSRAGHPRPRLHSPGRVRTRRRHAALREPFVPRLPIAVGVLRLSREVPVFRSRRTQPRDPPRRGATSWNCSSTSTARFPTWRRTSRPTRFNWGVRRLSILRPSGPNRSP